MKFRTNSLALVVVTFCLVLVDNIYGIIGSPVTSFMEDDISSSLPLSIGVGSESVTVDIRPTEASKSTKSMSNSTSRQLSTTSDPSTASTSAPTDSRPPSTIVDQKDEEEVDIISFLMANNLVRSERRDWRPSAAVNRKTGNDRTTDSPSHPASSAGERSRKSVKNPQKMVVRKIIFPSVSKNRPDIRRKRSDTSGNSAIADKRINSSNLNNLDLLWPVRSGVPYKAKRSRH